MAKAATATTTRKRPEIVLTASKQATVNELAANLWTDLFKPVEGDNEATAAAYKVASDQLQKFFEAARDLRDASKPVQRERLDTDNVMKTSVGKTVSDLQAAYIQLPIGQNGDEVFYDRIALPKLRTYAEVVGHPLHQAAVDFLAEHKMKFVEREGKGRGRKVAVLEAVK